MDIEPDWGISGWQAVREQLPALLSLLDRLGAKATFFVVSDMLSHCRQPLELAAHAHEIGSHGVSHGRLDRMPAEECKQELEESRSRLEEALQVEVKGIRAPFLAIPDGWFRMIRRAGYSYDSSVGSVYPSPVNIPAWRWTARRSDGIVELPPTTLWPGILPFSLTYLRILAAVGPALAPPGGVFYFHLHELAEPELSGMLEPPLRWALRRHVGTSAWDILRRLLETWRGPIISCQEWLTGHGF